MLVSHNFILDLQHLCIFFSFFSLLFFFGIEERKRRTKKRKKYYDSRDPPISVKAESFFFEFTFERFHGSN